MVTPKIYMYWDQGFDSAPGVVKRCVDSWALHNPDWDLLLHDASSLPKGLLEDLDPQIFESLPVQMRSDLIRLKLLIRSGGVWADATCFCHKPLDDWIHHVASTDFFMFSRPGRDREISNWFIAAKQGSRFLQNLYDNLCDFWQNNSFEHDSEKLKRRRILMARVLNGNRYLPMFWFLPVFTKVFRIYPYFVFHYLFFWTLMTNRDCRQIWADTQKVDAKPAILPQRLGLLECAQPDGIKALNECDMPVFKLNHHVDDSEDISGTYLGWVFSTLRDKRRQS